MRTGWSGIVHGTDSHSTSFFASRFCGRCKPRQSGGALSAKTIKSIIDGLVRHIKEIEAESDILFETYGDWPWTKGKNYGIVKEALKSYSMHRFSQMTPKERTPLLLTLFDCLHLD